MSEQLHVKYDTKIVFQHNENTYLIVKKPEQPFQIFAFSKAIRLVVLSFPLYMNSTYIFIVKLVIKSNNTQIQKLCYTCSQTSSTSCLMFAVSQGNIQYAEASVKSEIISSICLNIWLDSSLFSAHYMLFDTISCNIVDN